MRVAAFGLFLAPLTAFGAITSLTPLPPTLTLYDVVASYTVVTDSAFIVMAAGSGSAANLTVSTNALWLTAYLSSTFDHPLALPWALPLPPVPPD